MTDRDLCRSRRLQRFLGDIPPMLAACAQLTHQLSQDGPNLVAQLHRDVELCDESGRTEVAHCQTHYACWGRADLGGDRSALRESLGRHVDASVVSVYASFANAYFGAWHYRPGGPNSAGSVAAIDGRTPRTHTEVIHANTTELVALRHDAVVAGWLVEVEGLHMLLLACEMASSATGKLRTAAGRHAWGEQASFRRRDYEADVLALLGEPMCVDLETRAGHRRARTPPDRAERVFLSPVIDGWGWGVDSTQLAGSVQQALLDEGLDHRGDPTPWHLAVSRAECAADVDHLIDQLGELRRRILTQQLEPRHPIGESTLEVLLPSETLLETAGLANEGADLGKTADYLGVTLRQLGIRCHSLDQCGIGPDMTLDQVLPRTDALSAGALESLGDAIYLARLRLRWTHLIEDWMDPDSPWLSGPSLAPLLDGVAALFRAQLWHLPISKLPDVGPVSLHRGRQQTPAWQHLEQQIHGTGFTGLSVRLGDVYEFVDLLGDLDDASPTAMQTAAFSLGRALTDWPSGALWPRPTPAISQAG